MFWHMRLVFMFLSSRRCKSIFALNFSYKLHSPKCICIHRPQRWWWVSDIWGLPTSRLKKNLDCENWEIKYSYLSSSDVSPGLRAMRSGIKSSTWTPRSLSVSLSIRHPRMSCSSESLFDCGKLEADLIVLDELATGCSSTRATGCCLARFPLWGCSFSEILTRWRSSAKSFTSPVLEFGTG